MEGKQYSGSLITARLAMEFGCEVFGGPGNVTRGDEPSAEPVDPARNRQLASERRSKSCQRPAGRRRKRGNLSRGICRLVTG